MKYIIAILTLLCFASCQEREILFPIDYVQWFDDKASGLVVEKELKDFVFKARLMTPEVMALRDLKHENVTVDNFQSTLKKFGGNYYVQVRISDKEGNKHALDKGVTSQNEFYQRVAYFNFLAEPDFKLLAGTDTLHCKLLHFENTYGLVPFNDIQMAFPADAGGLHSNRDFTLIWDDKVLGVGTVKFRFDKEDIQLIPELKFR